MGACAVVVLAKFVEELLQLVDGLCWGLGVDPFFEGLVEPFDFALGLWVARPAVFLLDFVRGECFFERVSPAFTSGKAGGEHQAVICQRGCWWTVVGNEATQFGSDGSA